MSLATHAPLECYVVSAEAANTEQALAAIGTTRAAMCPFGKGVSGRQQIWIVVSVKGLASSVAEQYGFVLYCANEPIYEGTSADLAPWSGDLRVPIEDFIREGRWPTRAGRL